VNFAVVPSLSWMPWASQRYWRAYAHAAVTIRSAHPRLANSAPAAAPIELENVIVLWSKPFSADSR